MTLQLAERVSLIKPSPTLAVSARAAEMRAAGKDVIGLGVGEPDFDTPEHIKAAGIEAINNGFTKYTPVDGTPGLKQAIIEKFKNDNGLSYELNQILVSCGGKQSFYNMAQAYLNPGDEVIIISPYWVSYPDMVLLAGAKPVIIEAGQAQQFKMTGSQLSEAITDKTRLFVLNSPSNPTGMAYSEAELKALAEVLLKHPDILIATDDMYEHTLWDNAPFVNILNVCPELYNRTIVLNGVSKAYSMTGWRIGYAGGPEVLIKAMKKIQSQSTSNPTSISQVAAQAALTGGIEKTKEMVAAFKQRHDTVFEVLNKLNGVDCIPTDGTFYLFPSFHQVFERRDDLKDDVALAEYLITEANVALVPGSAFGAPGYMRLSIAASIDLLNEAMKRIANALK